MKKYFSFLYSHQTLCVFIMLTFLSLSAFAYYFATGELLLYGDANSRLNIARGVVDSLTPGFGQLSNVWLPLPTLLLIPFIWNTYLWHTGIAGAIVSMASFILGGVYLFKSAKLIANNFFAAFFATLIYALNINLLYLQTTAMSEPIFIASLIFGMYNLLVWIKNRKKLIYLIYAGIAMTASSLIRYEGWAVMLTSIPIVALYLSIKTRNYKQTEGNTILYATIALFGFAIWSLYLLALYGDPLYWRDVYLTQTIQSTGKGEVASYTFNLNLLQATWEYICAVAWTNGIIPLLLAIISLPVVIIISLKNKTFYFLPLLIQLAIFAFMVLTLQRNTPINQPDLTLANILSSQTNSIKEFNIRYGLTMLPFIALLSSYLLSIRFILLRLLIVCLLTVQVYSYFSPDYTVIYQIPRGNNIEMIKGDAINGNKSIQWLKENYHGGLIMISAKVHNPEMLELGFDFKTYIHEGTGKYWNESIHNPESYATWVVYNPNDKNDQVRKYLKTSSILKQDYDLVYKDDDLLIYKIKTHPTKI